MAQIGAAFGCRQVECALHVQSYQTSLCIHQLFLIIELGKSNPTCLQLITSYAYS